MFRLRPAEAERTLADRAGTGRPASGFDGAGEGFAQLAAENGRAIAAKEREDKARFESMKDKAERESRRRENYNASGGFWYGGRWYSY